MQMCLEPLPLSPYERLKPSPSSLSLSWSWLGATVVVVVVVAIHAAYVERVTLYVVDNTRILRNAIVVKHSL